MKPFKFPIVSPSDPTTVIDVVVGWAKTFQEAVEKLRLKSCGDYYACDSPSDSD